MSGDSMIANKIVEIKSLCNNNANRPYDIYPFSRTLRYQV